jgi:hypothetical protein
MTSIKIGGGVVFKQEFVQFVTVVLVVDVVVVDLVVVVDVVVEVVLVLVVVVAEMGQSGGRHSPPRDPPPARLSQTVQIPA